MALTDIGFAVFMISVFLAPELPVGNFSVSAGFVGIAAWVLLGGVKLQLARIARQPWVLAAWLFVAWALVGSYSSLLSSAYAYQKMVYLVGGLLMVAHADARPGAFQRTLTIIVGIYVVALLLSLWTGPLYEWQVGYHRREGIQRAVGTTASVNQAGGLAAVFAFLMIAQGRRWLAALAVAAAIATLSRSAVLSLAGGLLCLAAGEFAQGRERRAMHFLVGLLVLGGALAAVGVWMDSVPGAEGLETTRVVDDGATRIDHWFRGFERWQDGGLWERLAGHGLHSSSTTSAGVYLTAHNYYLEILADLGLVGIFLFALFMVASMMHVCRSTAATAALATMLMHNMTGEFLYHPSGLVAWFLCLAQAQAERQQQWERRSIGNGEAAAPTLLGAAGARPARRAQ